MEDPEAWSAQSNEAFDISIVRAGDNEPATIATFKPQFTYPIFGEEERIFGYQGLQLKLRFAAHDLRCHFDFSYDKKFTPVGDTHAADIVKQIRPFIAEEALGESAVFRSQIQEDETASSYKPPGIRIKSYTSKGRNFEIWSGSLNDPAVKLLVRRIQVLVPLFIEGGVSLNLDDQEWTLSRWQVFFVYEKISPPTAKASSYAIVGYSTSYRFITYAPRGPLSNGNSSSTVVAAHPTLDFILPPEVPLHPSNLPSRVRISQFLILPCHHSHGHGSHLYTAMYKTFVASPTCTEITVEDPNEAFDDLRDFCDYATLTANGTFSQINLSADIDPKLTALKIGIRVPTSHLLNRPLLDTLRHKTKIAPRQFYRLIEMHLMSRIPVRTRQSGSARLTQRGRSSNMDDRTWYYWRLLVKQRVYKQNKDVLIQLDRAERADKVEQAVGEIVGDYERLLRGVEKWRNAERDANAAVASTSASTASQSALGRDRRGKRKVLDDDDDDDTTEKDTSGGARDSKRARSEAIDDPSI